MVARSPVAAGATTGVAALYSIRNAGLLDFPWTGGQKQLVTLAAAVSAIVAFIFLARVF